MKYLVLMLLLGWKISSAQVPIISFAIQKQETEWYAQQANLWHQEINKNTSNSFAWYNYYYATRNWMRTNIKNDKRTKAEKMLVYRNIIDSMKTFVPQSFEYNLVEWMQSWNDPAKENYLLKAYQLDSNRNELISHMVNYGEVNRNLKMRDKYSKQWLESNLASNGLLQYANNMLQSVDENAIIMTEGDNDTYPLWQLQSIGIRKDVYVINASLIQVDDYRNKLFAELKLPPISDTINTKSGATLQNAQIIIQHIFNNVKDRKLYASVAMMPITLDSVKNHLHLTGILYLISKDNINSSAIIRKNIEQVYKLDYLETNFTKDISQHYVECLNANYVVPMITLYKEYLLSGEKEKAIQIKKRILQLSEFCEDKNAVLKQLEN